MSWWILAALSAACLGLYDVSKKAALNDNAVLPVLFGSSLAGTVLVLPVLLLSWTEPSLLGTLAVPALTGRAHLLIGLKAALITASWVLSFFAMKHLPISLVAPIRASAPLYTLLGAVVLFAERPNLRQWVGIGIILLAYWAFSVIGRGEGFGFSNNRWIMMAFAGTLLGAAGALYDKYLLRAVRLPPIALQVWFTLYNASLQGMIVLLAWAPRRRCTTPFRWRPWIPAVGVLLLVSDYLYFHALATEGALISVVSMIRRTNVVVSFTVGSLVFHDVFVRRKALALAGVLVGLWMLLGDSDQGPQVDRRAGRLRSALSSQCRLASSAPAYRTSAPSQIQVRTSSPFLSPHTGASGTATSAASARHAPAVPSKPSTSATCAVARRANDATSEIMTSIAAVSCASIVPRFDRIEGCRRGAACGSGASLASGRLLGRLNTGGPRVTSSC
jgi:transporter family protein